MKLKSFLTKQIVQCVYAVMQNANFFIQHKMCYRTVLDLGSSNMKIDQVIMQTDMTFYVNVRTTNIEKKLPCLSRFCTAARV